MIGCLMKKMAATNLRACEICPLNKTCKRYSNPRAMAVCQELAVWLIFSASIAVEVGVLFFH